MLILAGAWLALIGYALTYAGISKLGGQQCGLRHAFTRDGCQMAPSGSIGVASGTTLQEQQAATQAAQAAQIPGTVLV